MGFGYYVTIKAQFCPRPVGAIGACTLLEQENFGSHGKKKQKKQNKSTEKRFFSIRPEFLIPRRSLVRETTGSGSLSQTASLPNTDLPLKRRLAESLREFDRQSLSSVLPLFLLKKRDVDRWLEIKFGNMAAFRQDVQQVHDKVTADLNTLC